MKLIQNWSLEEKEKLKNFLIQECGVGFKDITVVGSRIHGGFHSESDIDVVVWMKNFIPQKNHHCIFRDVENLANKDNNFHVCISFRDYTEFENNIWSKYKYSLAKYSVIDDKLYQGNPNHLLHHKRLRQLIKDLNGWNVPFEQFEKENAYLLE